MRISSSKGNFISMTLLLFSFYEIWDAREINNEDQRALYGKMNHDNELHDQQVFVN